MPKINILNSEVSGGGVPTGTGTAFVAGVTDAGPPPGGSAFKACWSLTDFTNAFGARSSTSAAVYDFLNEFFQDGALGAVAYVTRVTDSTATTAALTLSDPNANPTVVVSAVTPGLAGNSTYIVVTTGSGSTFTANTTSSSPNLANISSSKNIGAGTPVSGTGIPTGTYIVSVNVSAKTAVMSANATATNTAVTITPGTATVLVEDSQGDVLETHGPYATTAQLFADTSSTYVSFAQSAGSGFTDLLPATLAATPLSGGADASDLTDSSHVAALANFPAQLGQGTVCLPGKVSLTAWQGLLAHAQANNRFAVLDMTDSTSSAQVNASAAQLGTPSNASYGMLIQGSLILPGITPGTTRTAAGSAAVAALRSRVAAQANTAQAPSGENWPLNYPLTFTTFFGPVPQGQVNGGCFQQSDVDAMELAGVNCFANFYGTPCLFGLVTPVSRFSDETFWQFPASCERMNLNALSTRILAKYLFDPIDTNTIDAMHGDLQAMAAAEEAAGALFDLDGNLAFSVLTAAPVNTATTAAAGQLNAQLYVRLTPGADTVNLTIGVVPVTQQVPAPVTA